MKSFDLGSIDNKSVYHMPKKITHCYWLNTFGQSNDCMKDFALILYPSIFFVMNPCKWYLFQNLYQTGKKIYPMFVLPWLPKYEYLQMYFHFLIAIILWLWKPYDFVNILNLNIFYEGFVTYGFSFFLWKVLSEIGNKPLETS